jgi:hypothetical protein
MDRTCGPVMRVIPSAVESIYDGWEKNFRGFWGGGTCPAVSSSHGGVGRVLTRQPTSNWLFDRRVKINI